MSDLREFFGKSGWPTESILTFKPYRRRKEVQAHGAVLRVGKKTLWFAPLIGGVIRIPFEKIQEAWAFPMNKVRFERERRRNMFVLHHLVQTGEWPYFRKVRVE